MHLPVYIYPKGWQGIYLNAWTSQSCQFMKPRLQHSSKVHFDSDAPKGAMGHTAEKQSLPFFTFRCFLHLNLQLFTLSVLKLAALWATNIESGSVTGFPKKNYFPLACHISWGLLTLQCSLLHSKQSLQMEKLRDTKGRKKAHNKAFIPFFSPKLRNETHWVAAAHIQKSYYASQSHPNCMNN